MNNLLLAAAALATVAFSPAAAADPRVANLSYEAGRIVTIHGRAGIQSTIAFGQGERIENVAVGNSLAWQVAPNHRADLLFVKPLSASARTNMTVITDRRTYLFDLVSGTRSAAIYLMRFRYPDEPSEPARAVAAVALAAAPVAAPIPSKPDPALLHFDWKSGGTRGLLPSRVFDDGRATYLAWPAAATLPAILIRDSTGAEGPINYTVQGDYLVIDGVPAQLVLRSGKHVATLTPAARRAIPTPVGPRPELASRLGAGS